MMFKRITPIAPGQVMSHDNLGSRVLSSVDVTFTSPLLIRFVIIAYN